MSKNADIASKLIGERRKVLPHETSRAAFQVDETHLKRALRAPAVSWQIPCALGGRAPLPALWLGPRAPNLCSSRQTNRPSHQSQSLSFPAVGAAAPVSDPSLLFQICRRPCPSSLRLLYAVGATLREDVPRGERSYPARRWPVKTWQRPSRERPRRQHGGGPRWRLGEGLRRRHDDGRLWYFSDDSGVSASSNGNSTPIHVGLELELEVAAPIAVSHNMQIHGKHRFILFMSSMLP